ncbi:hypothetical protein PR202_gb26750 [Eleusine coracana subsp. coracana]|uniref:Uncharacterized protein n=1 Tax=Eleusine coracana subsp. coracana TaxID=191504 RepID=A0AAV5FQ08_ELECO|nr:hypothetical protein PR202_gb26750 [Eleusine coracana subsp. coracana]
MHRRSGCAGEEGPKEGAGRGVLHDNMSRADPRLNFSAQKACPIIHWWYQYHCLPQLQLFNTCCYWNIVISEPIATTREREEGAGAMADWGPVVVATVLFVLLSPGLLLQVPGKSARIAEFGNLQTSAASIFVHAIIFFALTAVFFVAIGVHITTS